MLSQPSSYVRIPPRASLPNPIPAYPLGHPKHAVLCPRCWKRLRWACSHARSLDCPVPVGKLGPQGYPCWLVEVGLRDRLPRGYAAHRTWVHPVSLVIGVSRLTELDFSYVALSSVVWGYMSPQANTSPPREVVIGASHGGDVVGAVVLGANPKGLAVTAALTAISKSLAQVSANLEVASKALEQAQVAHAEYVAYLLTTADQSVIRAAGLTPRRFDLPPLNTIPAPRD